MGAYNYCLTVKHWRLPRSSVPGYRQL